jgi:hypothetical protein
MANTKVGNMLKSSQKSFLKLNAGSLLHNCYVMYFILFLAISDLLVLAVGREYMFIIIFLIVGFLTSFFSKNMMVIMLVAIVATNILRSGSKITLSEGLENKDGEEGQLENLENKYDDDTQIESLENAEGEQIENLETAEGDAQYIENLENAEEESKTESFDLKTKKATSLDGYPIAGLNVLGDQTSQLISTQQKLMENMKTLEPMLSQAEKFMSQFDKIGKNVSK